jgi:AraC family transcriptional regulator of adaptative response/methylated-DNA-[protein]-cysteine methyltransferase
LNRAATQPYADDETRWQAVLHRDGAADERFCYAVRSTGIYCRPTCPARRPRRESVAFFDTPDSAEQAGFRPCRRCHPNEVSLHQQAVAHVQHLLETVEPTPTLRELGKAVGLSPFHLQRLFKRATGLSPKQYAAALRAERLRAELKTGASVTAAMYAAGYGSSRALYDTARDEFGMNPSTYRSGGQGQHIAYALTDSPLGRMLIAATDKGICAVRFGEDAALVRELQAEFPRATLTRDAQAVASYTQAVLDHLAGRQARLDLPLNVHGTAFQERVWAALREIPYGQTRTYGEVAQMIGEPGAAWEVGQACATNPVALLVPCHRVVRSGGGLSGYRWGSKRKRTLLDQERAVAQRPQRVRPA